MAGNSNGHGIAWSENQNGLAWAPFPHHIEKKAIPLFGPQHGLEGMSVKAPQFREGVGILESDVQSYWVASWRYTFGATAMEIKENLSEALVEAEDARERLRKMMVEFRSKTKNDLDSMNALGKQIRKEMNRIQESMNATIDLMTSAPMLEAIENAQRLADALSSIDRLRSSKVSFAIIDTPINKVKSDGP